MTPIQILLGLLGAAAGAVGFAMMFRVRPRYLLAMGIGGFLSYAVYLFAAEFSGGEFFPSLMSAVLTAIYAEACAHRLKAPVQIFMLPVLVPLFPGGGLYYTMYYLIAKSYDVAMLHLLATLETAFGLAGGMIVGLAIATAFVSVVRKRRLRRSAAAKAEKLTNDKEENDRA